MLRVNSEFLHYFRSGCAETETVQSDYFPVEADVLIPNFRHACLNRAHVCGISSAKLLRDIPPIRD